MELAEEDEEGQQDEDQEDRAPAGQVVMVRNPLYPGVGGMEDWKETLRSNKRKMERHERENIWHGRLF